MNTKKIIKISFTVCLILLFISLLILTFQACMNENYKIVNFEGTELVQLSEISSDGSILKWEVPDDAPVAIITTTEGVITVRLYPEFAPKTVEQFIKLSNEGYYNGSIVSRVQNGIYAALGDKPSPPVEYERIPKEVSPSLWPYKGAIFALDVGTDNSFWDIIKGKNNAYTGSRFVICGNIEYDEEYIASLRESDMPEEIIEGLIAYGGVPNYAQKMAFFAQTIDGFDVLDKILTVPVSDADTLEPESEITIQSIVISEYSQIKQ